MKANRTGVNNPPPRIEDLGDGSFYYNFNVVQTEMELDSQEETSDVNWDYDQVRCYYPINIEEIQNAVDEAGYNHTVKIDE